VKGPLLVRIDDRLLHGQVALGWRHRLDPRTFLIVDDEVAKDSLAIQLFEAALPEGTELRISGVAGFMDRPGRDAGLARTIILIRTLATMSRLAQAGFRPEEVNLGGLHHRAGSRRFLDYLYLTDGDIAIANRLMEEGIRLYAQDLPTSPRRSVEELLATGGASNE
jgi:PTS system mannose-specific IIB component